MKNQINEKRKQDGIILFFILLSWLIIAWIVLHLFLFYEHNFVKQTYNHWIAYIGITPLILVGFFVPFVWFFKKK